LGQEDVRGTADAARMQLKGMLHVHIISPDYQQTGIARYASF
jgi:hypothetical protein